MNAKRQPIRTILKFDVGADGFEKMMIVLAVSAGLVLLAGTYFILFEFKKIVPGGS